jgi:hypothetical protein
MVLYISQFLYLSRIFRKKAKKVKKNYGPGGGAAPPGCGFSGTGNARPSVRDWRGLATA